MNNFVYVPHKEEREKRIRNFEEFITLVFFSGAIVASLVISL